MRIALVNWSGRQTGGPEVYLHDIAPHLAAAGHDVAFLYETDEPAGRPSIAMPEGVARWHVGELGASGALSRLRSWNPDLIYVHGLLDTDLETAITEVAPAVFFGHSYYGTCVSGNKTFTNVQVRPCSRRFGWQCLLHYHPHRCGGWSPVSMVREYRKQSRRLTTLARYGAIVTNSEHMRSEYIKHGFPPDAVHKLTYYVPGPAVSDTRPRWAPEPGGKWHLLFLGRMVFLKGGRTLVEALPKIVPTGGRQLAITFAGDGPERSEWERRAGRAEQSTPDIECRFTGWLSHEALEDIVKDTHLLVVPSVWPEPFGQVGPEVGRRGIPAAAFNVGGIPEWLREGVNGHLAPGNPPTAAGLATAIGRCIRNPDDYAKLVRGARQVADRFNLERHLDELTALFHDVLERG
ncbi:MAG: glycosyltransferase family 4 protein [Gemmatimonadales bacterium]